MLLLEPGTEYELKLTLTDPDPDGPATTRTLRARTRSEPQLAPNARRRHVIPGTGGGTGTETDPFRGLNAAQHAARPGDLLLLGAGVYEGTWTISRSGEPGRPIVWRGRGGGETIIDAQGHDEKRPGQGIAASGTHDVWFEDLTIQGAVHGAVFHDSARSSSGAVTSTGSTTASRPPATRGA